VRTELQTLRLDKNIKIHEDMQQKFTDRIPHNQASEMSDLIC